MPGQAYIIKCHDLRRSDVDYFYSRIVTRSHTRIYVPIMNFQRIRVGRFDRGFHIEGPANIKRLIVHIKHGTIKNVSPFMRHTESDISRYYTRKVRPFLA